jgi:NTE family protein/lysophospholipid hydrolase
MDLCERAMTVLQASRVFGSLDAHVLSELARSLDFQTVRGGQVVLREGEDSDSMLFVISGVLRVSRREAGGVLRLYNEIRSGQSIGEIGLILQQPRTADVTALRDTTFAVLNHRSFEALLLRHPLALNRIFVQAVYDFARNGSEVKDGKYAKSFVVIALHTDAGAPEVASSLTQALAQRGRVHHFKPPQFSTGAAGPSPVSLDPEKHDELEDQFDFLVYEADAFLSPWTRRAFRQADQVIFVASAGADPSPGEIETQLTAEPGFSLKRKHLVLLHLSSVTKPQGVSRWRGLREFERIYPIRQQYSADFARLARFLTGTAVGVVLGGGGARGFAHVGVLRALQEVGIPVDLVGGNSMGALIGAQYANGQSLEQIVTQTQRFASGGERPTLPLISLVSGRRVERDLKRMFGDLTIDDLWLPFFATACNLTKGITTVQDSGPLWRAVLASNSPAGLFPPVLKQGDMLVDGAILDNVPVAAMRVRLGTPLEKRRGNGIVIAIDVDVPQALGVDPTLTRLTLWRTIKSYLSPGAYASPGIASILYCAGHIGGARQRSQTIAQADHYLVPPVSEFSLMSYRRADEIVDVGYRYAIENISQWKHQIPSTHPTRV